VTFATDKGGSSFIQAKFNEATRLATATELPLQLQMRQAVCELIPAFCDLSTDIYGNYVAQKILKVASQQELSLIADQLSGNVARTSLHQNGCRVVQMCIEVFSLPQRIAIAQELQASSADTLRKCMVDRHACYVLKKLYENVPAEYRGFIVKGVRLSFDNLSVSQHGCQLVNVVIKELLVRELPQSPQMEHAQCTAEVAGLCRLVIAQAPALARNRYGNYVVQNLLQHARQEYREQLIEGLMAHVVSLSCNKFGSNVVEQCITHATRELRSEMISTMFGGSTVSASASMAGSQYAGFVVNRLLKVVDCPVEQERIRLGMSNIQMSPTRFKSPSLTLSPSSCASSPSTASVTTSCSSHSPSLLSLSPTTAVANAAPMTKALSSHFHSSSKNDSPADNLFSVDDFPSLSK